MAAKLDGLECATTWQFDDNAIDELAPLAAVPWAVPAQTCAYVSFTANPLASPDNLIHAATICTTVGLTLETDDQALSCAAEGCEVPLP